MSASASRPPGRPRSAAATTAVLDAAYRLSASAGLRGATIHAIAAESGVSKMTIYKWWDGRLALLIDAYLRQATLLLPISESLPPVAAIDAHARRYVAALKGDLGRVQLSVLAECLAEHGEATLFVERYLRPRRALGLVVIRRGQRDGSIATAAPAEALYDQIYGTLFYRCQFGIAGLTPAFASALVRSVLAPPCTPSRGPPMTRPPAVPSVQIDNDRVKVTEWRFPPGAETGWHRHGMDYVVVPMTTGTLLLETPDGEVRSPLTAGVSYTRPVGIEHNVVNANDGEFVFVEIELKQAQ